MAIEIKVGQVPGPFKDALREARRRQVIDINTFNDLDFRSKLKAFSVAGDLTNRSIDTILNSAIRALNEGKPYKVFAAELRASGLLQRVTAPELVYRNAAQNAYSRGRFNQQQTQKTLRPFLEYITFRDDRVRPNHAIMDGKVAAQDSSFWSGNYPPNGHRCRCVARALTQGQISRRGLDVQTKKQIDKTVKTEQTSAGIPVSKQATATADKGWDGAFNPPGQQGAGELVRAFGTFNPVSHISLITPFAKKILDSLKTNFQEDPEDETMADVFSATGKQLRKDALSFLLALPSLAVHEENFIKKRDNRNEFLKQDWYTAYNSKRLLGDVDLTTRIEIASAVIRRPIAVFRDFLQKVDTRQETYIEYFFGLDKTDAGDTRLNLVINHRGVMIKHFSRSPKKVGELLETISGLLVFKKF